MGDQPFQLRPAPAMSGNSQLLIKDSERSVGEPRQPLSGPLTQSPKGGSGLPRGSATKAGEWSRRDASGHRTRRDWESRG